MPLVDATVVRLQTPRMVLAAFCEWVALVSVDAVRRKDIHAKSHGAGHSECERSARADIDAIDQPELSVRS